ncbi:MAG: ATP-binding protein, partial [Candidatus Binatia bacterium]
ARVVIASRLGATAVPEELARRLHERTGGNPLFLEEVCRSLVESTPAATLALAVDALEIPPTVQAVIRARIDRLPAEDQEILRLASVLGQTFSLRLLGALSEARIGVTAAALERLAGHELVAELAGSDDTTYRFKHAITRDVAYDLLLRQYRRDLHRRAGRAIEATYPADRLEEHYEVLTEHYEQGEEYERAALFAGRAGDKAAASFSLNAARAQYRRAIALLDRLGSDPDRLRRRVDLSTQWAAVSVYDPAAARCDVLRTSYEFAERMGYRSGAARAVYWMGWFEHAFGNHETAVQHFERALELADPAADRRLISQLHTNLGQSFYHGAEFTLAIDHLSRAIRLRRGSASSGRTIVVANALGYLGLIDAERGDFAAAHARLDEALAIVRQLGQRQLEGSILVMVAFTDLFQGEWDACLRRAAEMRAIADVIGAPYIDAMSRTAEGFARAVGLEDPEGLVALELAVTALEASGSRLSMSVNYGCLAEALALGADPARATPYAHRALARSESSDRIGEIQAHRALGLACARDAVPRPDAARVHLAEGVRLADARGAVREAAVTRLRLAEVLIQIGDTVVSRETLEQATRAFETFGMRWHLAQASTLRRALGRG